MNHSDKDIAKRYDALNRSKVFIDIVYDARTFDKIRKYAIVGTTEKEKGYNLGALT